MNVLCNINQSFVDLLINYLSLWKKEAVVRKCSVKKVFLEILQIFKNTFFQERIPLVAASGKVNADQEKTEVLHRFLMNHSNEPFKKN